MMGAQQQQPFGMQPGMQQVRQAPVRSAALVNIEWRNRRLLALLNGEAALLHIFPILPGCCVVRLASSSGSTCNLLQGMIGSMMPQQQMGFGLNQQHQQPMQPFAPNPFKWYYDRIAIGIASVKQLGPLRIVSALTAVVSPTAFFVRRSLAGLESLQRLLGVLPPTEIDTSNQAYS